ncbi:MAG: hypothetical protein ACLPYS_01700 [Vulcanimicrobiaceae bacterium]
MSDDKKWPKIRPETVAPLRDGRPDLFNNQPTRFVSLEEAKARGWKHFWTGEPCINGHRAARYASNPSHCVDCTRIDQGRLPVYGKGVPELDTPRGAGGFARPYTRRAGAAAPTAAQPSSSERLFLTKYAELKDFTLAAEACGRTEAEFLAILSWNETFRDAVNRLEESLGVARTQEISEFFDWDDTKRKSFLFTLANTADMKQALRSVGVTNVQFHRELADNADFQSKFDEATQMSRAVFDHAAGAAAIKGDAKMLGRIAANFFPEKYGESLKMDLNVKQNLTLDQAHAQLTALIQGFDRQGLLTAPSEAEGAVIDAEYAVVEPQADAPGDPAPESESADEGTDPNSDLVSGSK